MAIRYQISSWHSSTAMKAHEFAEFKRLDGALNELWRQVFAMIEGNAGRDTKRGWQIKHEFDAFAARLEREPLKRGHYRHECFVWRNDPAGILEHVEFRQERI